jgi:prophage regulatory protein
MSGAPGLMGVTEIQRRLGGSRGRVLHLVSTVGFPEPVAVLRQGRVWLEAEVEAWVERFRVGERTGERAGGKAVAGC